MPLSADGYVAILDLLARANWAADAKDVQAYAAHFDADEGRISGAFEARPGEAFRRDLQQIFDGEGSLKRHALVNPVIEGDADTAHVTWLMPVFEGETSPSLVATCRVTDECVRRSGSWRIRTHTVEIDPSMRATVGQRT